MSVTRDTSHDPIGPFGPVAQSLSTRAMHLPMAAESSCFEVSLNTAVRGMGEGLLGCEFVEGGFNTYVCM